MAIQIIVADGQEVIRAGLVHLFRGSTLNVVATACSVRNLLQQVNTHQPACVLTDIFLRGDDGLKAIQKIQDKCPTTRVAVLTAHDNPTYVARAHAWGAADYLLKGLLRRQLIEAVTHVCQGQSPTTQGLLKPMQETLHEKHINGVPTSIPLTLRESQVLRHLGFGLSNREIGYTMLISVETVKEHVQNVLRKLNLHDRTQAAVWAVRKGII